MTSDMIFNVNLDAGFTRKARFVADINTVYKPPLRMYASVVSRVGVWFILMLEKPNGLDVKYSGVQNAYLNANPKERVWFRGGKYFFVFKGIVVVVIRDLYGMKCDGYACVSSLIKLMRGLGFNTCRNDRNMWMRVAVDTSYLGSTTDDGMSAGECYYQ